MRPRTWTAAVLVTAAVCLGFPPWRSRTTRGSALWKCASLSRQLSAVLSLAAPDARAAVDGRGDSDRFALDAIDLRLDGVRLTGHVERVSIRQRQRRYERPTGIQSRSPGHG